MPNQQNYSDKKGMLQAYASKGTSVAVATFIYHLLSLFYMPGTVHLLFILMNIFIGCMLSCFSCAVCQALLSLGFSRQEYWSGLPYLPPGDLPNPGIEPGSPALQADSLPLSRQQKPCLVFNSDTHFVPHWFIHWGQLKYSEQR